MSENSSPTIYFISGGICGVCSVLTGHPLDTLKVRLQTMPLPQKGLPPLYRGSWDCFLKTVKNEGVRGLYKGMSAPLTGVVPIFAISFSSFGMSKKFIKGDRNQPLTNTEVFVAGAFSGIFSSVIVSPLDHIKSLLQTQDMDNMRQKYKGSIDCAKQLYLEGGIRHIYKGTIATLLRDVPSSGMFYMTYETMKNVLVGEHGSAGRKSIATIIAGGLAGIATWIVAMPPDVLKSRLQTASKGSYPNGIGDVIKELMAREGPTAFYKGITPVMIKAFISNAACFIGFELTVIVINWVDPNI